MYKGEERKRHLLCMLILCGLVIAAAGCAGKDTTKETEAAKTEESETDTQSGVPAYLAAAEPVAGSDNLSEIHADFLQNGNYEAALKLGENLLLVYMYVPETDVQAEDTDNDGEYNYEENFCYQFDLYSPAEHAIIASVNTEETSADFYQIVGEELILVDYANQSILRYDETLTYLDTCEASALMEGSDGFLYASADADTYWVIDYEDRSVQKASITDNTCSLSTAAQGYYTSAIYMSSPDSSKLLLAAVDEETFRAKTLIADTKELEVLYEYSEESYYYTTISDQAFLAMLTDGTDRYRCTWFDGDSVYFTSPADGSVSLMGEYILLTRDNLYSIEESEEQVYTACAYNDAGICVSAMSYAGTEDVYMFSEPLYFDAYNCCFLLAYGAESGCYLLVWDLSEEGEEADNLRFYASPEAIPETAESDDADNESEVIYGDTVTMIEDPDSYDWGELSQAQTQANELEEIYGISIYLGTEIPSYIGEYATEQCLDAYSVEYAVDELAAILSLYPENFISQLIYGDLRGIRIYLTGYIQGQTSDVVGNPTAYVDEINHYVVMVLDADLCWDWEYTVNHEISHLIDRALEYRNDYLEDALFSEETWDSFNPAGFAYLQTYENYEQNEQWDLYGAYFYDLYGMTYATEDRAELFGLAVSSYMQEDAYAYLFTDNEVLMEKLAYYSECIRADFDTTGWPAVLPWETVLN